MSRMSQMSQMSQMPQTSLLIILINCLKGHKSLGSLCSVVKTLIVSLVGQTDQGTMSPIELFWTAKNPWLSEWVSQWMTRSSIEIQVKIHTGCFCSKFKQGDFFFKVHTGWFFSKSLQGDFLKISTGWFFQNSYRVIFWVRSCLLITLIKCLKGHKSLGSLGSVVKGFIVSWVQRTKGRTDRQGHLLSCLWTAKKRKHNQD